MIYGVSSFRIRKLPEKMTSINFLSINVDYVSIFIQESEGCFFFFRMGERGGRERDVNAERPSPGGVQFM